MDQTYLVRNKTVWEKEYDSGRWEFLKTDLSETYRYSLICNYFRFFIKQGSIFDVGCGEGLLLRYFNRDEIAYYKV